MTGRETCTAEQLERCGLWRPGHGIHAKPYRLECTLRKGHEGPHQCPSGGPAKHHPLTDNDPFDGMISEQAAKSPFYRKVAAILEATPAPPPEPEPAPEPAPEVPLPEVELESEAVAVIEIPDFAPSGPRASDAQLGLIRRLIGSSRVPGLREAVTDYVFGNNFLTIGSASSLIDWLIAGKKARAAAERDRRLAAEAA